MSFNPEQLKYTKDHEWVSLEGNIGTIGITEYAAEQLGDVVHVEFPEEGEEFEASNTFGAIESVKSVSDVYLPLSGKIVELNEQVSENPGLVNEDPYGEGWLVKVEINNNDEVEGLMNHAAYQAFLSEEA